MFFRWRRSWNVCSKWLTGIEKGTYIQGQERVDTYRGMKGIHREDK
jgi:hypothetical protein